MIINYTSKRTHRPDVPGTNLVTNPGPFNNTTGWTAFNSATLSATSGKLRVARNGVNDPGARQAVTVEVNELYLIDISFVISTPAVQIIIYDAGAYGSWPIYEVHAVSASRKFLIKTRDSSLTIDFYALTSVGTEYAEITSFSIKKITTLGHGNATNHLLKKFSYSEATTAPWVASNSTLSVSSGKLRVTNVGAVNGTAYDTIPTVPGCSYTVSCLYTEGICTQASIYIGESVGDTSLETIVMTTTATTYTGSFVATGTQVVITIQQTAELNAYNDYSAITVTQADSEYTLEKDIASESDERPSIGGWRQISIGGNAESNYGRKDEIHTVTTTAILSKSEADDWKEFFDSCAGGETFTIDLYQDPRPELITNGTFDSATTGWTGTNATLSISGRRLLLTNLAANGQASQSFATTVGELYKYSVDYIAGTASSAQVYIGTSLSAFDVLVGSMTATRTYTGEFIALSATTFFHVSTVDPTIGNTSSFDNVSVKSISTDNVVSAILEGDGKIDRISQHLYQATFSYRVI